MKYQLLIISIFIFSNLYSQNKVEEQIINQIYTIANTNDFSNIRDLAPDDSVIKNTPQLFRYCFDSSWEKKIIFSFNNFKNSFPNLKISQLETHGKYELYSNNRDFNKITLTLITPTDGSESAALKSVMATVDIIVIKDKGYLYNLELYGVELSESRKNLKSFESEIIIKPFIDDFISSINNNRNVDQLIIPKNPIVIGFQNCQETKTLSISRFEKQYENIVNEINTNIRTITSTLKKQDKLTLGIIDDFSKKDVHCFDYERNVKFIINGSGEDKFQIRISLLEYECKNYITDITIMKLE